MKHVKVGKGLFDIIKKASSEKGKVIHEASFLAAFGEW